MKYILTKAQIKRLIDGKVLIEELKKRIASHEKDADDFAGETIYSHITEMLLRIADETQAIIELVENQPKLATDTNVGCKWIPCSERLPEEEAEVIVTRDFLGTNGIPKSRYVEVAAHIGGSWYSLSDEYKCCMSKHTNPIAWMYLPEPYNEEVNQ